MSTLPQYPGREEGPRTPRLVPAREKARKAHSKKIAAAIGLGLLILLLVIIAALLILPHIKSFRQYALRVAEQKLSSSLGTNVAVRDFALSLRHLTLDLYSVRVSGAQPYPNPPLVTVDHLGAGLAISSLWRREWYVKSITVDHPVVRVFEDGRGTDNLPRPKSTSGQSHTDWFKLGVRHALLDQGELYYNNRKSLLDADLHELTLQARYEPTEERYWGGVSYRDGHLKVENYRSMPHDLEAQFDTTPTQFRLRRALLRSGSSRFELNATVDDFRQPRMQANYRAVIDSGEFRRLVNNPTLPTGVIDITGRLDYQSQPSVPLLASVKLEGDLVSRGLVIQTSGFRSVINDIGARYSVANGNAAVSDVHARLLGGNLTANFLMRDLQGNSRSRLRAAVEGVSLAQLRPLMNSSAFEQVSLAGTVKADADASWGKSLANLVAKTNATIQAQVAPRANGNAPPVPLNGAIHAGYIAARKEVSLDHSYLRLPNTALDLNGALSNRSSLEIRLEARDLHELETLADNFTNRGQPPSQLGLSGIASFTGLATGSTSAPRISGQVRVSNLHLRGTAWRLVRTNLQISPSQASFENGELQPADQGRITFNLSTALRHWSFQNTSPIEVGLNATQVNVADLTRLAGSQAPIAGILSARVSLRGSELKPVGQGDLSLSRARISSEPVQAVNLKFQGTGNELHANLKIQIPAGAAQGAFTYFPKEEKYQAELQALGIRLDQFQTVKSRNLAIAGILNITARGEGSLRNPELAANIDSPALEIRKQKLGDLRLRSSLSNHVANLQLDTRAVNTMISARAQVNTTGEYQTSAKIDTQTIPLQPLVSLYAPSQAANLTGRTELHATLAGPLKNKSALDAHAIIPILEVNYANKLQLAAASPIHIDFTNGVLALERTHIQGTGTDVELQASVPTSNTQPLSLLALGTLNLDVAQLVDPDLSTSGQLRFDINSYGARTNPDVQGQIRIVNANFASGSVPIGLEQGNGVLTLTKDRLNITEFTGMMGGGKVKASGGVIYKPGLRFDLAFAGAGVRLLYPEGVREGLDANLTFTGTTEAATLGGRVKIEQLSFTPDFDLTDFMSQFGGESTPPPTPGFSQNVQLNLTVESTSGINLVSRELSVQGNANLNVRGTADEPVILGRVNLSGGDLIFMGNRYLLQPGTIDFSNPSRTQPNVNLAANTTIQQYNIYLQFYGPADHLRTNYTSVPSLPPSDIINLLAFGKTSEASAANPTPGNLGAESLLASQVSSQVTSRVEKIAGISRLSVDPVLAGNGTQQNPGARITVQQRVAGNIFVTFATDVTQTQNQVIELQYNISPRVMFSGTRDQNGGFGFDTRIQKSW